MGKANEITLELNLVGEILECFWRRDREAVVVAPWTTQEAQLGYDFAGGGRFAQVKAARDFSPVAPAFRFQLNQPQHGVLVDLSNRAGAGSVWYVFPLFWQVSELRHPGLLLDETRCIRPEDVVWPGTQVTTTAVVSANTKPPTVTVVGRNVDSVTARDVFCNDAGGAPAITAPMIGDSVSPIGAAAAEAVPEPTDEEGFLGRDRLEQGPEQARQLEWQRRREIAAAEAIGNVLAGSFVVVPKQAE